MSKYNYFLVVTVDGYSFPDDPQVNFGFVSQGLTLLNRGHKTILYSFDGTYVHGDLNPNDASKGLTFDSRFEDKLWFCGYDGYGTVRVEAWQGSG